jgi:uncharacterized protein (UPF0332 family)
MTNERRAIIEYRMARAREAIDEAGLLFEAGHINAYVNRLYYACYYSVSALLLTKGTSTSKHGRLRALLHQELVKPGVLPVEMGQHFDRLFASRQKGDYEDLSFFKADEVAGWIEETLSLVSHVETLLGKYQGNS